MKKKRKNKICICESIYEQDAILLDSSCPIHGNKANCPKK